MDISLQCNFKFNLTRINVKNILVELIKCQEVCLYELDHKVAIENIKNNSISLDYLIKNGKDKVQNFNDEYRKYFLSDDIYCLELELATYVRGCGEIVIGLPTPTLQKPFVLIIDDLKNIVSFLAKFESEDCGLRALEYILNNALCMGVCVLNTETEIELNSLFNNKNLEIKARIECLRTDETLIDKNRTMLVVQVNSLEFCDNTSSLINYFSEKFNIDEIVLLIKSYDVYADKKILNIINKNDRINLLNYTDLNLTKVWTETILAAEYFISFDNEDSFVGDVRSIFGLENFYIINKENIELSLTNNVFNKANNIKKHRNIKGNNVPRDINSLFQLFDEEPIIENIGFRLDKKVLPKKFYYIKPTLISSSVMRFGNNQSTTTQKAYSIICHCDLKHRLSKRMELFEMESAYNGGYEQFFYSSTVSALLCENLNIIESKSNHANLNELVMKYRNYVNNCYIVKSGGTLEKIDIELICEINGSNLLRIDHCYVLHKFEDGEFPYFDFYKNPKKYNPRIILNPGLLKYEIH